MSLLLPASAQQNPKASPKTKFLHGPAPGADSALLELRRHLGPAITAKAASAAAGPAPAQFQRPTAAVIVTPTGLQIPRVGQAPLEFRNEGPPDDTEATTVYEYRGFDAPSELVWLCRQAYDGPGELPEGHSPRSTHLLVSPASGQVIELVGPPRLNAARTLVLAEYQAQSPEKPAGLQLWRVEKGRVRLLQHVQLSYWYVERSKWLGPNRLWLDMGSKWDLVMGMKPCHQMVELTIR